MTDDHVSIWWIYFVTALQEVVVRAMNPYVTSAFRLHSLTAATGIMSSIIGGLSKIPLAKLLDMWGRPQGLLLSLFVWMVGYIMMASCRNVETYAAAQVFSSTGYAIPTLSKPPLITSSQIPSRIIHPNRLHRRHIHAQKPRPHALLCHLPIRNHNLGRRPRRTTRARRPRLALGIWHLHHHHSRRRGPARHSRPLQ
jgi:hypothetical protein